MSGQVKIDDTEPLDEMNQIVSVLAHWIGLCDAEAALLIFAGFEGAQATSALLRSRGAGDTAIAGLLAGHAEHLRRAHDARHAGWLLCSVKAELGALNETMHSSSRRDPAAELLAGDLTRDVDQLTTTLENWANSP